MFCSPLWLDKTEYVREEYTGEEGCGYPGSSPAETKGFLDDVLFFPPVSCAHKGDWNRYDFERFAKIVDAEGPGVITQSTKFGKSIASQHSIEFSERKTWIARTH